jgi:hypothetical protein
MAESTPHFAPIVVLMFLGAVFVTGVGVAVLLVGTISRSMRLARIGAGTAIAVAACYMLLLCGVSLASHETVLSPGGWKYFCELDCHIAYSVDGVESTRSIGPEIQPVSARGQFVIVHLKIWFDEHTISPRRGDGPLTPNARRVLLLDASGGAFAESPQGEAALARAGSGEPVSFRQPLRPGESISKTLVFDVPKDARGLRLLLTEDDPETRLVIGHENSLLHKKIYLALDSTAATTTSAINPLAAAK